MSSTVTLRQVLSFGAEIEKSAAQFYRSAADKFAGDSTLAEVFSKLAEEEAEHHGRFEDLQRLVSDDERTVRDDDEINYLKAMAASDALGVAKGSFHDLGATISRDEALSRAFAFEKATLAYYQAVRDVMGPHEVLDAVVNMEKAHVVTLMKVMVSEGKLRSLEDPWS